MTTLAQLRSDPLGPRCTGISDDDLNAMAREELSKLPSSLQAGRDRFVAWLAPYRKDGVIEQPWDYTDNSCEAVMIHDRTGNGVPNGVRIMVHPAKGIEHEINGVKVGFFPADAFILVVEQ